MDVKTRKEKAEQNKTMGCEDHLTSRHGIVTVLLLSVINPAGCRFLFALCASIAIDTTFLVAEKFRTDFDHANFG